MIVAAALAGWGAPAAWRGSATGMVSAQGSTRPVFSSLPSVLGSVFVIVMENQNWSSIKGSAYAHYINGTLLTMGAHAEQYFNPPSMHPSEPNYIWLEAGSNLGITTDNDPSANHQSTTNHLVTLLQNAGISWKAYAEGISGASCPLTSTGNYAPRHVPFLYFDDVTAVNNPSSPYCIQHVRPYSELTGDLRSNAVPRYVFITPDLCDDMHNACAPLNNPVQQGDTWLSQQLPQIFQSAAYQHGGVVFITWDEGQGSDGPIGLIALSPYARFGYASTLHYTHSSLLRTIEETLGVTPLLGDAANASDLGDLFSAAPTSARVTRFTVGRRGSTVRFRWNLAHGALVAGFAVYAGGHRLNRGVIPIHTATRYHYRARWSGGGTYRLAMILVSGRQITVAGR